MTRITGSAFVLAASFVASVGMAQAADLPVSGSPIMSPVAVAFSWTGLYAGVHGGYAWGSASTAYDTLPFAPVEMKPSGGYGGGQIGVNYQLPQNFVVGIEADVSFGDIEDTVGDPIPPTGNTITSKIDYSGTVRGRLGYAFGRALVYGTGGLAWAHAKTSATNGNISDSATLAGWTAGGGVEYAVTDHWSLRTEYLHVGFGSHTWFDGDGWSSTGSSSADTVRVGANYRF